MAEQSKQGIYFRPGRNKALHKYVPTHFCQCGNDFPNEVVFHVGEERDRLHRESETYRTENKLLRDRIVELEEKVRVLEEDGKTAYEEYKLRRHWEEKYHKLKTTLRDKFRDIRRGLMQIYDLSAITDCISDTENEVGQAAGPEQQENKL